MRGTVRTTGGSDRRIRVEIDGADRYEGYLPSSLVRKYTDGLNDAELTGLRRELALLDVRIKGLVETLAEGYEASPYGEIEDAVRELNVGDEAEVRKIAKIVWEFLPDGYIDKRSWARLRQLANAFDRASDKADEAKMQLTLGALFRAIRTGGMEENAWDDIVALMEVRRRIVSTEVDREMRSRRLMDVENVIGLLGALVKSLQESVTKYIPDRNMQEAIFYDAEQVYSRLLSTRFSVSDDAAAMARE